jgi:disulfide bond formation protein DsbB
MICGINIFSRIARVAHIPAVRRIVLTALIVLAGVRGVACAAPEDWVSGIPPYHFVQTVTITAHFADQARINAEWQKRLIERYGSLEAAAAAGEHLKEERGFAVRSMDGAACEVWVSEKPAPTVWTHETWGHCFQDRDGQPNVSDLR